MSGQAVQCPKCKLYEKIPNPRRILCLSIMISAILAAAVVFIARELQLHAEKISEAQKQLVEATKPLDHAAKMLASRADVMHVPGGIETAREQILAIQTAGKLSSWETAEWVAVSTHWTFGTSGQLLTPNQLGIAGTVASFTRLKDISPEGIDHLLRVLAAMGVTNEEEAQWRIQQLSTVQQASRAKTFEQFTTGGAKSIIPALAAGASPEMAMAQYAAALDLYYYGGY